MAELRILLFVDSPDDRSAILGEVRRGLSGARIDRVGTLAELDERLLSGGFDAALSDFPLGWIEIPALITRLKSACPFCPVLLYTASGDVELAAAAMRMGLDDYVIRSAESYARLPLAVEVALNRARGREAADAAERAHRERATELEALLETIPAAVWVAHDPRGRRISGNRTAHELLGVPLGRDLEAASRTPRAPRGDGPAALATPGRAAEHTVQSAAASRRPVLDQELEVVDRRGETRVLYGSAVPLFTDAGAVRGALAAFVDVTALRQAEAALRLLAEAGRVIARSLDYETTLQSVAGIAIPTLADWCVIDVLTHGGQVRRLAAAHAEPARQPLVDRLKAYPPLAGSTLFGATGRGEASVGELAREMITPPASPAGPPGSTGPAGDTEHAALLTALAPGAVMSVPLVARGRTLGVWTFVGATSRRGYDPEERALAEELALRAGQAIDNARLYRESLAAGEAKDRFLAALSHELRTPLTPVLAIVSRHQQAATPEPLSAQELDVIRRNLEREAWLIEDLLAATSLGHGAPAGGDSHAPDGPDAGAIPSPLDALLPVAGPTGGLSGGLSGGPSGGPDGGSDGQRETSAAGAAGAAPEPAVPRAHILLVEDHVDSAEALADLLRWSGYQVTWAPDAEEALLLAESAPPQPAGGPFDLVISDLGLPGMSGFDLMRRLSERFGLPGIALSGYSMSEDLRRSRECGFTVHLVKPVDVDALRQAIATLERRAGIDPPAG